MRPARRPTFDLHLLTYVCAGLCFPLARTRFVRRLTAGRRRHPRGTASRGAIAIPSVERFDAIEFPPPDDYRLGKSELFIGFPSFHRTAGNVTVALQRFSARLQHERLRRALMPTKLSLKICRRKGLHRICICTAMQMHMQMRAIGSISSAWPRRRAAARN